MLRLACSAAAAGVVVAYTLPALLRAYRRATAKPKLTYFNIRGMGEHLRLALAIARVPFDDVRLDRDGFQKLKPELKFGQLPVMHLDNDKIELVQTAAIMRYIAQAFEPSLYSSDPIIAATIDAMVQQVQDMQVGKLVFSYRERFGVRADALDDEHAAIAKANYYKEVLPRHLTYFEKILSESPTTWLVGTAGPTIADITLACTFGQNVDNKDPLYSLPKNVAALVKAFYDLPAVKAFIATDPLVK